MRKIVKSDDVNLADRILLVREEGETVEAPIEDVKPEPDEAPPKPQRKKEEPDPTVEARLISDEIIKKAAEQANRIIGDASQRAQVEYAAIMEKAHQDAETARQAGFEQGYQDGARSQVAEIRRVIGEMEGAVSKLEGRQAGYLAEYEQNLKWLALEIASKVLAKRLKRDDADMAELVKEAIASLSGAKWVTVEISNTMPGLFDALSETLRLADRSSHTTINQIDAPPGTCIVDSPSGVIDASIYTQLENLKDYFTTN